MAWGIFIAFMLTAYIPDPIPFVDEIGLGGMLIATSKELTILAIIVICVLFYFGIPPIGLMS